MSDGTELSARHVKESLDRLKNTAGPRKSRYSFLKEVNVLGEKDLELKISGGLRQAVEALSLPPAGIVCCRRPGDSEPKPESPETLENNDIKIYPRPGKYVLKEWKKNNYVLLERNPYWKGEDLPKKIRLRILAAASTGVFLFSKGRMDLMRLPNFLLRNPNIRPENLTFRKGGGVQYVAIRAGEHCFDLPFRKALNAAVDPGLIVEKLLEGNAEPTIGPIPPIYLSSSLGRKFLSKNGEALSERERSLDAAREFLKDSVCYPKILEREIDFRMRGDDENNANGAAIAGFLKNLGLKVKIRPMEKAALYKENAENKGDLTLLFWYADLPGAWNFIDPLFSGKDKGNGGNRAHYERAELETLFERARKSDSLDPESETSEALRILVREVPWIYLWSPHETFLISEKAKLYPSLADYL